MISIFDDCLLQSDLNNFLKIAGDVNANNWGDFRLNWSSAVGSAGDKCTQGYFTHMFYHKFKPCSPHCWFVTDVLVPFYLKLNDQVVSKCTRLYSAKLNLFTVTHEQQTFGLHSDLDIKHNSLIYYLNDCNGFTVFEDGSRTRQKKNRCTVITDGHTTTHASTTSTDSNRCNINLIFVEE
jgi:hypothetical protein